MLTKRQGQQSREAYAGKRAAVLGAAGFIGRWVARELCRQGAEVFLVVRDRAMAEEVFSKYEVEGEIIEADLAQLDEVGKLIEDLGPDTIFNLAGYGVDRDERDEETAYQINARLVETLCRAMAKQRRAEWAGRQIVHVGSALEYGEVGGNLAEDSVVNPTTLYGKSKLLGTHLLSQNCQQSGVKGVTARLFTVYGPGEHTGRLLPALLEAAGNNEPLPLTSGLQKRDFTYVGDVAEGLLRLGVTETQPGEVVNLATGRLTSVHKFVEIAAQALGIPISRLEFGAVPTRLEEMQHDEVTIDRLRRLVDWAPSTAIADGIRLTRAFEQSQASPVFEEVKIGV